MGIVACAISCSGMPTASRNSTARSSAFDFETDAWAVHRLGDLIADAIHRVQACRTGPGRSSPGPCPRILRISLGETVN